MGLAAGGAIGCAEERPPINRVQAEALAKSFFVGNDLTSAQDDPEFYMRGTVVDVGYGAKQEGLFTSTYAQPVSRVRWEITEDYLNARLAYERIAGTDGKGKLIDGLQKKTQNDGQIVASYKITSHFDIKRAYNPTTGEEQNVIEENSTDRPWYEREYFRVDWSQNIATDVYDFDTLSMLGVIGGVQYEPLAYTVLDPNAPDAPHFDAEQGYFDVTNKAFATPGIIDLSSLGWDIKSYPACFLPDEFAGGTAPAGDCNPVELTIRQSFKKVVDKDYEPVDYDGVRFQAFGIFNFNYRYGYERNYGLVDNRWFRFAARYNIWERSHYYKHPDSMEGAVKCASQETTIDPTGDVNADPNRDADGNGTADECEAAGPGSRCDVFNGKCTLPYQQRNHVTIPWYIGGDTSEDLFEPTNWATQEWDVALKSAVQVAKYVECKRTGGTQDDCQGKYPMWTGQQDDNEEAVAIAREYDACQRKQGWGNKGCDAVIDTMAQAVADQRGVDANADPDVVGMKSVLKQHSVIVLCHNPVIKGDHPNCGGEGLSPRLGDLRYNSVLVIEKPQTPSAWGIMVDADDPITGEKVAASINIWSHVTDLASQGLVDLVRYINGELPLDQVTNGKYIRDWAQASRLHAGGAGPRLSNDEVNARLASYTKLDPAQFAQTLKAGPPAGFNEKIASARREALDAVQTNEVSSPSTAAIAARANMARGTPMEAVLMNQPMLQLAGVPGDSTIDGTIADRVSPLRLNNPKLAHDLRQMRDNAWAKRGACIIDEAPEASSLTGIAEALARKFPKVDGESSVDREGRYKKMWEYVRRRYHYAVLIHEMGHSVGLRHNFVSSYASMHYRPQYWQLRTKNGTVKTECSGDPAKDGDGSTCVGPRYFDPLTDEEQKGLIWMFMQSDVMDYPGDVSQDTLGLGAFNFAAARMFYGDNVSVFADSDINTSNMKGPASTMMYSTDTFGGLIGIAYGQGAGQAFQNFHYSQLQSKVGLIHDCKAVTPQQPASWNADLDGIWDPLLDGKVVTVDGATTKCRQRKVDYLGWSDLRMPNDQELAAIPYYRAGNSVDPKTGRVRVPYSFATDTWADLGNQSVFRHDNGADPYEQTMFYITTQEDRHMLDNYRRERTDFSVRAAMMRSFDRYNMKMVGTASGLGFFSNIYKNFGTSSGWTFDTLWPLIVGIDVRDNAIAASVAFDHFARELGRPQAGWHYYPNDGTGNPLEGVLHAGGASNDPDDTGCAAPGTSPFSGQATCNVVIPNGSTGYFKDVGFGGHPLENQLCGGGSDTTPGGGDCGDFSVEYTENAGSYYDKINSIIFMTESEDRFISQSRGDFYDARFRAAGLADVFPDGVRRLIGNSLTGDRSLLGPRLVAQSDGTPVLTKSPGNTTSPGQPFYDPNGSYYPDRPMAWTSWWPKSGPQTCMPIDGRNICFVYPEGDACVRDPSGQCIGNLTPEQVPARLAPVDPQIGWEVQKFIIAWSVLYITANDRPDWVDQMRIYKMSQFGSEPSFENRIEWQDPTSGQVYYARTYGQECLFGNAANNCAGGKMVEKGIAARVLQYANQLTSLGYMVQTTNQYGRQNVETNADGSPKVAYDPTMVNALNGQHTCNPQTDPSCVLATTDNRYAKMLGDYKSVPDYLWQTVITYGLGSPEQLGLFNP